MSTDSDADLSQWLLGLGSQLKKMARKPLPAFQAEKARLTYGADAHSLWLFLELENGPTWALRPCYDPAGCLAPAKLKAGKDGTLNLTMEAGMGLFEVDVRLPEKGQPLLRVTANLTPSESVHIYALPRDLYVLGDTASGWGTGSIRVQQRGPASGFVYFEQHTPAKATGFYFQNLTALNDYCGATQTEPSDCVGGVWPELGMALPPSKKPLAKGKRLCLSDAFLLYHAGCPANEIEASTDFTRSLAAVYPLLPHPETHFCDWPHTAGLTLRSLTASRHTHRTIKGGTFLNAYVGTDEKPPESMVHAAVLLPMLEYASWQSRPIPMANRLLASLPAFYDPALQTVVRWLPGQKFKKAKLSEEEDPMTMDSWYLYHVLINLGRLAALGHAEIGKMFLDSLPYAIRVARHFDYTWPVFFRIDTLETLKKETSPGHGGEFDVPGLYVKVMVQAYRITKNRLYLEEAERAARELEGRGFDLLYQTNNTMSSAVGLLWLWQDTDNRRYLDLSRSCIANVVAKFWIWESDFGHSGKYSTFMGVSPLHDGSYISAYEEAESLAAAMACMLEAREELMPDADMLLSEYIKYVLERGRYYYPATCPRKSSRKSRRKAT